MQRYIFLDLDDTLFQTLRKCPPDEHLQAVAFLPDGSPNSYATPKQQWLWQWFSQDFEIVPVTGRDFGSFRRVNLPFKAEAVLNHGAVILDKFGAVDEVWQARMQGDLPPYLDKLQALWTEVDSFCRAHEGFRPQWISDFDSTWYGVIKHNDGSEESLKTLLAAVIVVHQHIIDGSLYWHLNGNNLAVLPRIINKESAVDYLLGQYQQQHGKILTFGAGDSKTDAPFLALCDYALIPKNTQLAKHLLPA
jgi:hydroxymethylpyrimidine pyrophosphatase-like HAD family hydrolase